MPLAGALSFTAGCEWADSLTSASWVWVWCLISISSSLKLDDITGKAFIPRKTSQPATRTPLQLPFLETASDLDGRRGGARLALGAGERRWWRVPPFSRRQLGAFVMRKFPSASAEPESCSNLGVETLMFTTEQNTKSETAFVPSF